MFRQPCLRYFCPFLQKIFPELPTNKRMLVKLDKSGILTLSLILIPSSFVIYLHWIPYPIPNLRKLVKRKKVSLLSPGASRRINADIRMCVRVACPKGIGTECAQSCDRKGAQKGGDCPRGSAGGDRGNISSPVWFKHRGKKLKSI
jgi:hypothetical protein